MRQRTFIYRTLILPLGQFVKISSSKYPNASPFTQSIFPPRIFISFQHSPPLSANLPILLFRLQSLYLIPSLSYSFATHHLPHSLAIYSNTNKSRKYQAFHFYRYPFLRFSIFTESSKLPINKNTHAIFCHGRFIKTTKREKASPFTQSIFPPRIFISFQHSPPLSANLPILLFRLQSLYLIPSLSYSFATHHLPHSLAIYSNTNKSRKYQTFHFYRYPFLRFSIFTEYLYQ